MFLLFKEVYSEEVLNQFQMLVRGHIAKALTENILYFRANMLTLAGFE